MERRRENNSTLKDVARRAQVHPSTVSRALDPTRRHLVSPQTRERVEQAVQELGYMVNAVARSLRLGATGLLGVIVPDVANPFFPLVLRGIEQDTRNEGMQILIAETHNDSRTLSDILEHFISRRIDALVLCAIRRGDLERVRAAAQQLPVVLAVRGADNSGLPTVVHDDVLGGRLAAQHLVDLGHHALAQLRGPRDISSFVDRAAGFDLVMARTTARDVSDDDVATVPTPEEGRQLTARLLDRSNDAPTAIFAHNDLMALGALDAVRERGLRCPEDISIMGYNDAPLSSYIHPPLTSIRLPALELGRQAAKLALAAVRGEEAVPTPEPLPPEIVVRASTAPPSR